MMIYKICPRELWEAAVAAGELKGAEIDLQDGYIHFSTGRQVQETASRHFSGRDDLVLVAVDEGCLGSDLRWEPSRGGETFPHLFSSLDVTMANGVYPLRLNEHGEHGWPDLTSRT